MANHRRSYEAIRLPRWLRWTLYVASAALFVTGVLWLAVHYGLRERPDDLPHPTEPWILRMHGLATMVALFVYGSLLRAHMISAWNLKRNRFTGACIATGLVILTATGYLLYYAGGETARPIISVAHWAAGLAFGGLLPLHIWKGRRCAGASVD